MMNFGDILNQMAAAGPVIDSAGNQLERIATALEGIQRVLADIANYYVAEKLTYPTIDPNVDYLTAMERLEVDRG